MNWARYVSRKFVAAMASLISANWALYEHLIEGDAYKTILVGVMAAYVAGNVAQKAVEKDPTT